MDEVAETIGVVVLCVCGVCALLVFATAIAFVGLAIPSLMIWGAWSLTAVPLFGAPAITFWQAFGMTLAIAFVVHVVKWLLQEFNPCH